MWRGARSPLLIFQGGGPGRAHLLRYIHFNSPGSCGAHVPCSSTLAGLLSASLLLTRAIRWARRSFRPVQRSITVAGSQSLAAGEFGLIARHLTTLGARRSDVVLGVGDDAAILDHPTSRGLRSAGMCIALAGHTREQLTQNIEESVRHLVGQLAGEGFTSAWVTLALTLPQVDDALVQTIADALHNVCMQHNLAVIGGDTTAGKASLTIFVLAAHD
ncbi:MAG: hypothetical protein ACI9DC_005041 [Gammaproteobacteria bacterium]|jgi:hypothetical protein